ncbi:alpha/beta hydrolase-fold protein [Hymenobacter actinosclerus]|uniref:Putative esterase n=1 Tax=Hymenobacter actinosclerus TaxID=82805 RepID=A0A1I0APM0_9BACT|nr:alpha/beta hydrolase-fold protein [Hymenobacter actinosclerus]SES95383.1 Putative esterase [Hymenobacter actinosclerus]
MRRTILLLLLLLSWSEARAQQFAVSYTPGAYSGPFTGNVILYLSRRNAQPKDQPGWPCYRLAVRNVRPGQIITFSDSALSYPTLLSRLERGSYYVQAVWDLNREGRIIGQSTGNPYSLARQVMLGAADETFRLVCDRAVPAPVFVESTFCKEFRSPSVLLTRSQGKPVSLNAAVILPVDYHRHPRRRYPVLFTVGGFGGDYHHYSRAVSTDTLPATPIDTMACIRVYLDGACSLGHSVYANSANNGPVGDAFTTEFLPLLDQHYRTNGARLLRGHSSGGYTVVYLLTHYPRLFAGGNASAPDPVDFHRFELTNLYTATKRVETVDSVTYGELLPVAAAYDRPNIMHRLEDIIYRGEQEVSFDAVFSPKGRSGLPRPLFNSTTNVLDRRIFAHWQQYDLTRYVRRNWPRLRPDLNGKLRISAGNEDSYYLNFSAMLMEQEMKKLGADMPFAYYPGDHFSVMTPEYKGAEIRWLKKTYLNWLTQHPQ